MATKRRKPKAQRKDEVLRLRVTNSQKERLTEAAQREELDFSAWALAILLREAKRTGGESEA
jgi:uncharacterized protein (DUF1778 family)